MCAVSVKQRAIESSVDCAKNEREDLGVRDCECDERQATGHDLKEPQARRALARQAKLLLSITCVKLPHIVACTHSPSKLSVTLHTLANRSLKVLPQGREITHN